MNEERKSRYELYLEDEARKAQPTKLCSKCGKDKVLSEYYNCSRAKDGKQSQCKECNKPPRKYKSQEDRFWKLYHSRTIRVGECLEWTGYCVNSGYPVCNFAGKETTVRRIVYRLSCGELPDDMFVSTTCRNKKCVRHSHLIKLTKEEKRALQNNSTPFGAKNGQYIDGRSRAPLKGFARGSRNKSAKIMECDVCTIRTLRKNGMTYKAIADRFGVDSSNISLIVRRITWAHVE